MENGKVTAKGFEHDLKEIKKDAKARFKLYRDIFDNDSGKLLLAYMEDLYSGKADFTNDRVTYFNLGMKEVVRQIKTILTKEEKGDK